MLGRVIDAVAWILGDVEAIHKVSSIKLVRVAGFRGYYLRWFGLSPYLVEIESNLFQLLRGRLTPIADWFGIGICTRKFQVLTDFAQGQIGGMLKDGDRQFFVTCSHCSDVYPADVVYYRSSLSHHTFEPDVALLTSPGAAEEDRHYAVEVVPADEDPWLKGATHLVRRPGGIGTGYTLTTVGWAQYSGRIHEFPHILVSAHVHLILDAFVWPPWRKLFSRPGHSGSFVIDADQRRWAGLLVGGREYHKLTYAAVALPLVRFLMLNLKLGENTETFTEEG